MTLEQSGSNFVEQNSVVAESKELADLSEKYSVVKELGAGANDVGYLVNDGEQNRVALVPKPLAGDWEGTLIKVDKVKILDDLGLSDYGVHRVETGLLPVGSGEPKQTVIVEYGGKPITEVKDESQRLAIAEQMLHVTRTLHDSGYAINDFHTDHWLQQTDETGRLQVKLIDYRQIIKEPDKNMQEDMNDHRKGDLAAMRESWKEMFPWANFEPTVHGKHADLTQQVQKDLDMLRDQSSNLGSLRKATNLRINQIRRKLGIR